MNKLLATLAIAASLLAAGSSAHAGIFSEAIGKVKAAAAAPQISQPSIVKQKLPPSGSLSYLGNKPYMQCLQGMYVFAKNDADRATASRECTARYYQ